MSAYPIYPAMKKDNKELRLLVVEDNPGDQLLLKSYLKRISVPIETIYWVDRLSEVPAIVQLHEIDLAFLDLTLPDSNGIDSFHALNNYLPNTPIIVLSGISDMEAALETIALGAQDYLMKGEFDERLLAKSIQYSVERKKTLQALKESNERYEIVNKATQDLIWDWNLTTNQVYCSSSIKEVLGYTDQYVTIEWVFEHVHLEDRAKVRSLLSAALQRGDKNLMGEHRLRASDGTYKYVFSRGYILSDKDGKPYRIIGASTDITEKRNLEIELATQQLNHQKLITEMTIQAQEKERNELAKELHDNINQVLSTVKVFMGMALDDEQMRESLVRRSYENVSYAIEEIRKLSKSLVAPSLGDIGLFEALEDLTEEINLTKDLKVQLQYDVHQEKNMSTNLELMLYRIVQEQMNNIIKYAKASKVTIVLKTDSQGVFLSIADNGVGFNPSQKAKGIGLTNISSRVAFYSGTLAIISAPGKGCVLEINIPFKN